MKVTVADTSLKVKRGNEEFLVTGTAHSSPSVYPSAGKLGRVEENVPLDQ